MRAPLHFINDLLIAVIVIDGSMSLDEAHKIASQIEDRIKRIDKDVEQVVIHCEPY